LKLTASMIEMRNTYNVLVGKPEGMKDDIKHLKRNGVRLWIGFGRLRLESSERCLQGCSQSPEWLRIVCLCFYECWDATVTCLSETVMSA
jgi:hypothetical protein